MTTVKKILTSAKAALKPAVKTFIFAFLGVFLVTATGWITALMDGLSTAHIVLPDISTVGHAVTAAAGAGVIALINFGWRFAQQLGLPLGSIPQYVKAKEVVTDGQVFGLPDAPPEPAPPYPGPLADVDPDAVDPGA
jgi:hypothetical protein